jgi:hypothetical protein
MSPEQERRVGEKGEFAHLTRGSLTIDRGWQKAASVYLLYMLSGNGAIRSDRKTIGLYPSHT